MFIALFLFWLLLNGHITLEIIITGAVISGIIYLLIWKFFGFSPKRDIAFAKRLPKFFMYFLWLIGEIFRSAMAVIKLVWTPKKVAVPHLAAFNTKLKTSAGKVLLANSITMTPGTITVSIDGDRYLVHCLDETFAEGLEDSEMEKRLAAVEDLTEESDRNDS